MNEATCNNCLANWKTHELRPIKDVFDRIAPGEIVPAGECPDCGALCHLVQPPKRVVVNIHGGLVQDVYSDAADVEVVIVDWDQEGVTEGDVQRDEGLTIVDGQLVRAHEAIAIKMGHMDEGVAAAVQHATAVPDSSD